MRNWVTISPATAEPYIVTKDVDLTRAVAVGAGIGSAIPIPGIGTAVGGLIGGIVAGASKLFGVFREKKHVNRVVREILFASLDKSGIIYVRELERTGTDAYFPSVSTAANPSDILNLVRSVMTAAIEAVSGDDRDDLRNAIATLKVTSSPPTDRRGILITFDAVQSYGTVNADKSPPGQYGLREINWEGGMLLPVAAFGIILFVASTR